MIYHALQYICDVCVEISRAVFFYKLGSVTTLNNTILPLLNSSMSFSLVVYNNRNDANSHNKNRKSTLFTHESLQ